jgi:hypothetical protein
MLRIPHCLDNRLTGGGDQPYTPAMMYSPETLFSVSDTHFYQKLSKPQGLVLLERLGN